MAIRICSLDEVNCICKAEAGKKLDISLVSLRDTNSEKYYRYLDENLSIFKDSIISVFDDIPFKVKSAVAPTAKEVRRILKWAKNTDGAIIVHCTAGISRSSAIAYLIEFQRTNSVIKAAEVLNYSWHCPNKLIISHGASLFNNAQVMMSLIDWENFNKRKLAVD